MINMIVAMCKNREIGKNNNLLFHLPEDLKYFKKMTLGHVVIMGSKTFYSLPNGALPNRENIVITRTNCKSENVHIAHSVEDAIKLARELVSQNKDGQKQIFIIGGASIYEQCMPYAERLYITYIFEECLDADTYFPVIDNSWNLVNLDAKRDNIEHRHPHVFLTYERNLNE